MRDGRFYDTLVEIKKSVPAQGGHPGSKIVTDRLNRLRLILILGLLFSVALAACRPDRKPTTAPTWQPPAVATDESAASASPVPTHTPSVTPTALPSSTPPATAAALPSPTTPATPSSTDTPVPMVDAPAVAIDRFTVNVEEIDGARQLTFNWETTGATRVRILSGTKLGQIPWDLPPDGIFTAILPSTNYRNPPMTLTAQYSVDPAVVTRALTRTVTIPWECSYDYFFAPQPAACPLDEAISSWAAEQVFEGGRMLWLQEIRSGEQTSNNLLFVLYNDGEWKWYPDTWTPDQPESDPSLTPPQGRVQPQRGFGKVWRDEPEVRERLGWGMSPEQGYHADWQAPIREFPPGAAYISTYSDGVLELSGWRDGTWRFVAPPQG